MVNKLSGMRSLCRKVGKYAVCRLIQIASKFGSTDFMRVTRRPRSLSADARTELLPVRYTYRADSDGIVKFNILVPGSNVSLRLHEIAYSNGARTVGSLALACEIPSVTRGDVITLDLLSSSVSLNNSRLLPAQARPLNSRKFVSEIQQDAGGRRLSRLCTHYIPYEDKKVGADYYFGDDYIDYNNTSTHAALALMESYGARGRLLDVGCALGIYSKAFLDAGFDVYATDISEFAIARASLLLGPERTSRRNLDLEDIPFEGSFDTVWMWDVIEHFSYPETVLAKISSCSHRNALLFLHTSNSNSLTHRLFGADWEGYSDYSHRGIDQVTTSALRVWLERLGWEIIDWETHGIWAEGFDPVLMTLKEMFETMPEMRVLLNEMDLCDTIRVVARKRSDPVSNK